MQVSTKLCSHRFNTGQRYDLAVIHTNEGSEGPRSAENLASYLAQPNVSPGYHEVIDEDSTVICCPDSQRCYGAGGVNSKAWHACITGYAAQSSSQWHDASSQAAIRNTAERVRQACQRLGIPLTRIVDSRTGRGICGHVDVSRYYSASQGHTDPGTNFPWDEFMRMVTGGSAPPVILSTVGSDVMSFIQVKGGNAIACTNLQTKNIFGSPLEFQTAQWCAAVAGVKNVDVQLVDQKFWDSLPTVG